MTFIQINRTLNRPICQLKKVRIFLHSLSVVENVMTMQGMMPSKFCVVNYTLHSVSLPGPGLA